jgi:hypothetical protein
LASANLNLVLANVASVERATWLSTRLLRLSSGSVDDQAPWLRADSSARFW